MTFKRSMPRRFPTHVPSQKTTRRFKGFSGIKADMLVYVDGNPMNRGLLINYSMECVRDSKACNQLYIATATSGCARTPVYLSYVLCFPRNDGAEL
jgi:hypothetical protein